jgi:hypothetical protein
MGGSPIPPERFIGTTMRPRPGREQDAVTKIAAPCCVCGYWQRHEWLDDEGMCEPCIDAEEDSGEFCEDDD